MTFHQQGHLFTLCTIPHLGIPLPNHWHPFSSIGCENGSRGVEWKIREKPVVGLRGYHSHCCTRVDFHCQLLSIHCHLDDQRMCGPPSNAKYRELIVILRECGILVRPRWRGELVRDLVNSITPARGVPFRVRLTLTTGHISTPAYPSNVAFLLAFSARGITEPTAAWGMASSPIAITQLPAWQACPLPFVLTRVSAPTLP